MAIRPEYCSEWKLEDEIYYPVNDEESGALQVRYKELVIEKQ